MNTTSTRPASIHLAARREVDSSRVNRRPDRVVSDTGFRFSRAYSPFLHLADLSAMDRTGRTRLSRYHE